MLSIGRQRALATGAALVSVAIWANFLVTTGGAVGKGLGIVELGLLRVTVSTVALIPVLMRIGIYPRGQNPVRFAVMILGGGVSFMFLAPLGFAFAPAATSGIFAPGMLPLWVAALSFVVLKERISPIRLVGFALIAAGVLGVGGLNALQSAGGGAWIGYMCFSGASLLFALYAIAQRGSGLSALEATALVNFWSAPIGIGAALFFGVDYSAIGGLALAWTGLAQFLSGVVAIVTYTYAIIHLGPSRGSAFVALTPAVVALASDIFLDQPASAMVWIGVAVVSAGVLIASGVLDRSGRAPERLVYQGVSGSPNARLQRRMAHAPGFKD